MAPKTPSNVSDAIRKLSASEQVAIQTYIASLKSTIDDFETEALQSKNGDDDHAHYHGHEKCTSDHGHEGHHDHHEEEEKVVESCGHDHDHAKCEHEGHSHEHEHKHEHKHEHSHEHSEEKEIPAWKKKAMDNANNADPNACPFGGSWNTESSVDATASEEDFPAMWGGSNDDFDKATEAKMAGADLKSSGKFDEALEKYTEAILAAEPSALLLANRAHCLLKLDKCAAAIRDCNEALTKNPDSAKALRIRGESYVKTERYPLALKDLSAAQSIDFDGEAAEMLKETTKKCAEVEALRVKKKNEEEDKLRKRAAEIKKAQEVARKEAEEEERERSSRSASGGGMPGGMGGMPGGMGGMPGGMGGMPGGMGGAGGMPAGMEGMMAGLMSDPEIAAGMQNPKVMKAFQELMSGPGGPMGLMSNPAKMQELMADPEVGPFMQKLMGKVMGGGGGMPGMGGMGGMPGGMGGMGGGFGGGDDDDMPDLDGDDDDDDMPDLVD